MMVRKRPRATRLATAAVLATVLVSSGTTTDASGQSSGGPDRVKPGVTDIKGFYLPAVGDFDGDGDDDVFWHHADGGRDSFWRHGPGPSDWSVVPITVHGSYDPAVGDFNGDGRDDIFWSSIYERDAVWLGNTQSWGPLFTSVPNSPQSTASFPQLLVGDFDTNGVDDIFFYVEGSDANQDQDEIWFGEQPTALTLRLGPSQVPVPMWDVHHRDVRGSYAPRVGAFTGHDRNAIFWFGWQPNAPDSHWTGRPNRSFDMDVDGPRDVGDTYRSEPLVGDYNGDGDDDIAWPRNQNIPDALWDVRPHADGDGWSFKSLRFSVGGLYRPFVLDANDDGEDDIWWYNLTDGPDPVWYSARP